MTVVDVGEVRKYSQIEGLTDRPKLLHQNIIQAGKVVGLERRDDRIGEGDCAGLDGVVVGVRAVRSRGERC